MISYFIVARAARAFAANYPQPVQSLILLAGEGIISIAKIRLWPCLISNSCLLPEGLKPVTMGIGQSEDKGTMWTPLSEIWQISMVPMRWVHRERDLLVPTINVSTPCDRFPKQVKIFVVPNAVYALLAKKSEASLEYIMTTLAKHPQPAERL